MCWKGHSDFYYEFMFSIIEIIQDKGLHFLVSLLVLWDSFTLTASCISSCDGCTSVRLIACCISYGLD